MLVDVSQGDHPIDGDDHHFGGEPFPFVDEGAFAEGAEDLRYFIEQSRLHAFFEPQGDDGHDIGQAVEEGGGDDVLFFVHLVEGFYKGFVKGSDGENGGDAHNDGEAAVQGGEIEDGGDGEDELGEGIYVHKAAVEKFPEGLISFADPVDGGAAVVVL